MRIQNNNSGSTEMLVRIRTSIILLATVFVSALLSQFAIAKSCGDLFALPKDASAIVSMASEADFKAIVRIANQHRAELGQVLKHNLKTGINENSLLVARSTSGDVIGFILWHRRQDGWSTIYDIAVDRGFAGAGIGQMLMNQVPRPRQLKTAADNEISRKFYLKLGLRESGRSSSRTGRDLILYRDPIERPSSD
jgi:ribosomal protein S18 acetylase RimI-like enzyme